MLQRFLDLERRWLAGGEEADTGEAVERGVEGWMEGRKDERWKDGQMEGRKEGRMVDG